MVAPRFARRTLDPGLFSDHPAVMQRFYEEEVGLPFLESLPHSPTYREIFFSLPEGKLKIQAFDEPMPPAVTGYRGLVLARPGLAAARSLVDPDGLPVELVPPGRGPVTNVGIRCAVADVDAQQRFYVEGMGAEIADGVVSVGDTCLFLEEDPNATRDRATPARSRGFVYVTLIVHEAEVAHRALLDAGAEHSLRIMRLHDRCLFSWVRDPHGNWLEIVQYAELSGPLPDIDRIADHWDEVIEWRERAVPSV